MNLAEISTLLLHGESGHRNSFTDGYFFDSGILYGNLDAEISRIICGIDVGAEEIITTDRFKTNACSDLLLSHHPEGRFARGILNVIDCQRTLLLSMGLQQKKIDAVIDKLKTELIAHYNSCNLLRIESFCEMLETQMMCLHTPADTLAKEYLDSLFENHDLTLGSIISRINLIPECKISEKFCGTKSEILFGSGDDKAGKIFFMVTGGTSLPNELYENLSDSGVETIAAQYFSNSDIETAKKCGINVISLDHIAIDSLGMNLALDAVRRKGIPIIPISGFISVDRT
ncbi:hypothetical protein [Methanolacinia paynteri]|uniref:hypothetical protein n=1 Tax=Methanolacinia paynteri TaxID=230356 RepID=UPI00064F635C|nr:hypothetical protein [Methanolacinia paynteri]